METQAKATQPGPVRSRPRRAPTPEQRQRDADRSRQLLLAAALDVFAAKGFAGARVQEIADRAGINKQLITYYFGGKEGLYREIQRLWLERDAHVADPDRPLDEVAVRYLHEVLADPRMARLMFWRSLADADGIPPDAWPEHHDLSSLRQRQARGELAPDLDPAAVLLAIMGAVLAPIAIPHMAQTIFGLDPQSPEFEQRYSEQLRRIVRCLASGEV